MEAGIRFGHARCRQNSYVFCAALASRPQLQPLTQPRSRLLFQSDHWQTQCRRHAHNQSRRRVSSTALNIGHRARAQGGVFTSEEHRNPLSKSPALSVLPLSTLILSYATMRVSSSPTLLQPCLKALSILAHSKSPFLNPDQNPILGFLIKKTLYSQFCAGETPDEVGRTIQCLKSMGYRGVILAYAKEVVMNKDEASLLGAENDCETQAKCNTEDISAWERGTLATVRLTKAGDFVALKFTGAGREALQHLAADLPPSPELERTITTICEAARVRKVRLLFDAEQAAVQKGIDRWTLTFMEKYNRGGKALIYGTYQAYLKSTPATLTGHLEIAERRGFILGVKLVRGAYLGSDPRELIWSTIEETHKAYDGIAEELMRKRFGMFLTGKGEFPEVCLVLASHNSKSMKLAQRVQDEQARRGEARIDLVYGQLMGMADHVSCSLVQAAKEACQREGQTATEPFDIPRPFKYLVWGSVGECTKYLLRRAHENQDAVMRTAEARMALGNELLRRLGWSS